MNIYRSAAQVSTPRRDIINNLIISVVFYMRYIEVLFGYIQYQF